MDSGMRDTAFPVQADDAVLPAATPNSSLETTDAPPPPAPPSISAASCSSFRLRRLPRGTAFPVKADDVAPPASDLDPSLVTADAPPAISGPLPATTATGGGLHHQGPCEPTGMRCMTLSNGLKCCIIRVPEYTKAAACLSISAGYFGDPQDLRGLSQLLQRLVFYGNGRNDEENFSKYIVKNGGLCRLNTTSEKTTFSFDVDCDRMPTSLERFAELFLKPIQYTVANLFVKSAESDIGHNEENQCELRELQKYLTSKDHPYHKFSYENWKTSKENALRKGLDIGEELKSFHDSYYSANLMDLAVCGPEPLDNMQDLIERKFSLINNNHRSPPQTYGHPCTAMHKKILVRVVPKKGHSVTIQWPLTHQSLHEVSALKYVSYTLGHKGAGSIFSILKKMGWCSDVRIDEKECSSEFSFISVVTDLTEDGKRHFEDISGIIFNFIKMMKKVGPRRFIFDQLKNDCEAQFNNGESSPTNHVINMSTNMKFFPEGDQMNDSSIPLSYSKDAIRKIVNMLAVENVRIFWESDAFEGLTNSTEPSYGTPYTVETLNENIVKQWMKIAPEDAMLLPPSEPAKALINAGTAFNVKHSGRTLGVKVLPDQLHAIVNENPVKADVCIIYDERMKSHRPHNTHPEQAKRISAIYEKLEMDRLLQRCALYESENIELANLIGVHTDAYILRILGEKKLLVKDKTDDMYYNDGTKEAILLAAGGALKASKMVASGRHKHAFAIVRPPGHHAKADEEGGFCYLNNVAIAASYLKRELNKKKILIIDWDIHFGDGTESIFKNDKDILFISLHRLPFFPFNTKKAAAKSPAAVHNIGEGYTCNVCWKERGVQDDDFYAAFDYIVLPLAREFNPEIILLSGGFDAVDHDLLGDCCLSKAGYATALDKLMQLNKSIIIVLEGGYNVELLGECCAACGRVLCGDTSEVKDSTAYEPFGSTWDTKLELRGRLKEHWSSLSSEIPQVILDRRRIKKEQEPKVPPPRTRTKPPRLKKGH